MVGECSWLSACHGLFKDGVGFSRNGVRANPAIAFQEKVTDDGKGRFLGKVGVGLSQEAGAVNNMVGGDSRVVVSGFWHSWDCR